MVTARPCPHVEPYCESLDIDHHIHTIYELDDLVSAEHELTEAGWGTAGDPDAVFPEPAYIHATIGDHGTVVDITEDGYPTVRFHRTGTATLVHPSEVRHV